MIYNVTLSIWESSLEEEKKGGNSKENVLPQR
jgi:hypothetical protein